MTWMRPPFAGLSPAAGPGLITPSRDPMTATSTSTPTATPAAPHLREDLLTPRFYTTEHRLKGRPHLPGGAGAGL